MKSSGSADASDDGPAHAPLGLRARIVEAATSLFAVRGYQRTSMREVGESAGCTKAAVYYHFAGKDALFAECIAAQAEQLSKLTQLAQSRPGSVRARIVGGLSTYFDHIKRNPRALAFLHRSTFDPDEGQPPVDLAVVRDIPVGHLRDMLDEGVRNGEVRPNLSLDDAVLALVGMVEQRCQRFVFENAPIEADCPERIVDIFFNGVST